MFSFYLSRIWKMHGLLQKLLRPVYTKNNNYKDNYNDEYTLMFRWSGQFALKSVTLNSRVNSDWLSILSFISNIKSKFWKWSQFITIKAPAWTFLWKPVSHWIKKGNRDFLSHNSDFFSHNCLTQTRNSDLFSLNIASLYRTIQPL